MYDYYEVMTADILDYIRENYTDEELNEAMQDRADFAERLDEELWCCDSVTGNGSGSYTFNRWKAQEYVQANPDLLREALREFCVDNETIAEKFLDEEWEYFDVTIRCYCLRGCIENALDELEQDESEEA